MCCYRSQSTVNFSDFCKNPKKSGHKRSRCGTVVKSSTWTLGFLLITQGKGASWERHNIGGAESDHIGVEFSRQ